ncbi:MAG: helix-turn-helix domain-containing protein, partial [Planctomycetota bacterium]
RGTFRADLYFRLKVVTLSLPELRERREDIVPLIDHFRKQFTKRHHKTVRGVSPAASRKLFSYDWPGNVRQLRNAVETMVVLDIDGLLDVDDLPPELVDFQGPAAAHSATATVPAPATVPRLDLPTDSLAHSISNQQSGQQPGQQSDQQPSPVPSQLIGQPMEAFERYAIEQTLQLTHGNREEAARILEIGARTLYRKLDKFKGDGE